MSTVFITQGLPASGKTTWAREKVAESNGKTVILCRDDFRAMLGVAWSEANEKAMVKVRDAALVELISQGKNVIIADTNFGKSVEHIKEVVGKSAEVKVVDFTDVPLEECIERDRKRGDKSVGEKVIRRMYNQFLRVTPEKPAYIDGARDVVICDLDGTIALMGKRDPYNASTCEQDEINQVVDDILYHVPYSAVFVSGRSDKYRAETSRWLDKNGYGHYPLYMRKEGDNRDDRIVKQEIYNAEIKGKYNVMFVLDDRNKVVQMWRDNGLTCLQVAEGDF